ncbi:MAG: rhomboid family intramembrane serine protease [Microbacteriaceae bacterium]
MSDTRDANDFCYRHPNRQSYMLCQRCGRTVCPECQTQASVGVHCPECIREARARAPKRKPAIVTAFRRSSNRPVVTYSIMAMCAVVFLLQVVLGDPVFQQFGYAPFLTETEPWRMVTSAFLHSTTFLPHILFNMYALFVLGPDLERLLGRGRFIALYLISAFGGSVAVLLLGDPYGGVLGASGAIFGLFGALFVIQRRLGGNTLSLVLVIGANLVLGFVIPNISWQAHVGGLLTGALVAFVLVQTRQPAQRLWQIGGIAGIAVGLIAITAFAAANL